MKYQHKLWLLLLFLAGSVAFVLSNIYTQYSFTTPEKLPVLNQSACDKKQASTSKNLIYTNQYNEVINCASSSAATTTKATSTTVTAKSSKTATSTK